MELQSRRTGSLPGGVAKAGRLKTLPAFALLLFCAASITLANTITVNSTSDVAANDGQCTLREAIIAANTNTASGVAAGECVAGAAGLDTIAFNIPGVGVRTIAPTTSLPPLTEAVTIDGYTQPGASANTLAIGENAVILIELSGGGAGPGANGLVLTGGSSTVRGLAVNRFNGSGITLQTGGNNIVSGNFVGTNPAGTAAQPNGSGIDAVASSNNTIGGTTPGARNLASANINEQVLISGVGASNNQILGNYIGPNAAGNASLSVAGNRSTGITVQSANNTIGGTAPGAGNLISGNANEGIFLNIVTGTVIRGNLIGTDGTGTIGNSNGVGGIDGVSAIDIGGGSNNTVGGATAGSRNVIAGNVGPGMEEGILIDGSSNLVQGNFIGINALGNPLGNAGPGILAQSGSGNSLGGTGVGEGNVIAFNALGVEVRGSTTGNAILSNSIFSNSPGLGIDLHNGFTADGVTPNDPCDVDTGPNNFQNFPVLTSAIVAGGNVTISGTVNGGSDQNLRIEFFSNAVCDPSGNGEGQTFLGSVNVLTDTTTCNATFGPLVFPVPSGQTIFTATASDSAGDTSEFSACFSAGVGPPPPPFTFTPTPTGTVPPTSTPTPTPIGGVTPTVTPQGPAGAVVPTLSPFLLALFAAGLALSAILLVRRNG